MRATRHQLVLIVLALVLTISLPILAAFAIARDQALEREENLAMNLASGTLMRSEQVTDQLIAGARVINAMPSAQACSPAALDALRKIDLESTMLQAAAHIRGSTIDCSSFAGLRRIELGPPDFMSEHGVRNWTGLRPFENEEDYIGAASGSFLAIIHKNLLLSYVDKVDRLAIGTFAWSGRRLFLSRGRIDPRWLAKAARGPGIYRVDGKLVAIVKSKRLDLGSIAVLPQSRQARSARELGTMLVPLGLAAGLLLAALLVRVLRRQMAMPGLIRRGLRNGEFHVLYQPAVDLATGRTIGGEALIRWRRPNGKLIPPDHFIAVAEEAGIIRLITERVLDLIAKDARDILGIMPDFHFSVNFSAADMQQAGMFDTLSGFVCRAGMRPDNLVIEATERSLIDVAVAQDAIGRLREAGIKVAIDDFGTGYSSLGYLGLLKIDLLKIDRLFVQALGTDSATSQVASHIINMAKDLKLLTVAEGIETADQASCVRALGVDFAQGFHFGPPMTADRLLERLRVERSSRVNVTAFQARAA
jgi:sensor c-di-GMP phosphodiesterase-like protein